ncbi:hypothetical protein CBR_g49821 [Chara braunii]|uniref:Uncharacterized protein n=1 Tax=Chara braunii TaxID=69332 RepID=A0A388JP54_CHABU|nr:hypothetical protein CBR_g49821 [Chara braunii]|eukprot:GBG59561.1 hypothetical protein CBR_g49821 [Chara braunii]
MVDTRTRKSIAPSEVEQARIAALLREKKEKRELLKQAKLKAIEEEAAKKKKRLEEEMMRVQKEKLMLIEKEKEQRRKAAEEEAAKEEEEEKEEPLERRRREERGEVSGTKEDDRWREKKISEWVANLSLGEDEEAQLYVPHEEREAFARALEMIEDPLERQETEDEKKLEWKLKLMMEKKRREEASRIAEEVERVRTGRQELQAQTEVSAKLDKVMGFLEILSEAWLEEHQARKGQDVTLQATRSGLRAFASDVVGHVGAEVRRLRDGVDKFGAGAIETAKVVATTEATTRPRKEPLLRLQTTHSLTQIKRRHQRFYSQVFSPNADGDGTATKGGAELLSALTAVVPSGPGGRQSTISGDGHYPTVQYGWRKRGSGELDMAFPHANFQGAPVQRAEPTTVGRVLESGSEKEAMHVQQWGSPGVYHAIQEGHQKEGIRSDQDSVTSAFQTKTQLREGETTSAPVPAVMEVASTATLMEPSGDGAAAGMPDPGGPGTLAKRQSISKVPLLTMPRRASVPVSVGRAPLAGQVRRMSVPHSMKMAMAAREIQSHTPSPIQEISLQRELEDMSTSSSSLSSSSGDSVHISPISNNNHHQDQQQQQQQQQKEQLKQEQEQLKQQQQQQEQVKQQQEPQRQDTNETNKGTPRVKVVKRVVTRRVQSVDIGVGTDGDLLDLDRDLQKEVDDFVFGSYESFFYDRNMGKKGVGGNARTRRWSVPPSFGQEDHSLNMKVPVMETRRFSAPVIGAGQDGLVFNQKGPGVQTRPLTMADATARGKDGPFRKGTGVEPQLSPRGTKHDNTDLRTKGYGGETKRFYLSSKESVDTVQQKAIVKERQENEDMVGGKLDEVHHVDLVHEAVSRVMTYTQILEGMGLGEDTVDDVSTESEMETPRRWTRWGFSTPRWQRRRRSSIDSETNKLVSHASNTIKHARSLVSVLKDENRELEEDTVNLQQIANGQWREIEAAARLEAKNGTKRRVILPCRWNDKHSDWEVAVHQSLQLVTAPISVCVGKELQNLIGEGVPSQAYALGDRREYSMELGEEGGEEAAADFIPLLLHMQAKLELKDGLIWMPWQVLETIPYGLLGGEVVAEWAARCAAVAVRVDAFAWKPEFLEKRISSVKHLWEEGERRWKTVTEMRRQLKGCHKLQENLGMIIEAIPQAWKHLLLAGKQWGMGDWATWEDDNEPKEVFRIWGMENSRPDWLIADKYEILQPRNTTSQLDMSTKVQLYILKHFLRKVRVKETEEFTVYNSTVAIEELEVDPVEWAWNIRSGQTRVSRTINILHYTTRIGYRLRNRSYSMLSTLLKRWEKRVGVPRGQLPKIPWANIGNIRLGQVRSMQWLIAHVALPVNVWLNERRSHRQRSVENEMCRVCQEGILETMLHRLMECAEAVAMWDEARGIWSQVAGIAFPGSRIALLLGVGVPKQWQTFQRHIFQLLRQYGLWTIWKRRCQATMEGTLMHRQEAREIFLTLTETHLKAQRKRVRQQARQQPEREEEIMKRFKQNVLGQGAVANIQGAQLVFKSRGGVEDIRPGG